MAQHNFDRVAAIVSDAGGRVVGRTKLQKIAYILEEAGLGGGYSFDYYHYGPFSDELASEAKEAVLAGALIEKEQAASWGGSYSTYETATQNHGSQVAVRAAIAQAGAKANSVELELAATALYLAKEGHDRPWDETARRKPEKADGGRIDKAKDLYKILSGFDVPKPLPKI